MSFKTDLVSVHVGLKEYSGSGGVSMCGFVILHIARTIMVAAGIALFKHEFGSGIFTSIATPSTPAARATRSMGTFGGIATLVAAFSLRVLKP